MKPVIRLFILRCLCFFVLPDRRIGRGFQQTVQHVVALFLVGVFRSPDMINPVHAQRPNEAAIVGGLVIGYSELDITLCHVAGLALDEKWAVLKALHSVENEGARLEIVNNLVRHKFEERGHEGLFGEIIGAMRYCKGVRNQYAHAQWMIDENDTILFASTRDIEWAPSGKIAWKPIDLPLLERQKDYFDYTRRCLISFEWGILQPKRLRKFPAHMTQPKRHNAA